MSTKAPKAATLVTTPSRIRLGAMSLRVSTPSLNTAALKAGRGSRPGFSSSRKISVTDRQPECVVDERLWRELAQGCGISDQVLNVALGRLDDPPHHRIRFRMNTRSIEWVVAVRNAKESGALLERLRS